MAKSVASNPVLESVGSHSVSSDYSRGVPKREECFPVLTATWRGQTVRVQMEASRYVASSWNEETNTSTPVWTEWRVFIRGYGSDALTDTARHALNAVCTPLVMEWLAGNSTAASNKADSEQITYADSRKIAFAWMIRREIREEKIDADYPAQTLALIRHELTDEDYARFNRAVNLLREFLSLL